MLFSVKLAAARVVGAVSRRSGRGGTSLPGKLLMRMEPDAIARLAARLPRGSAVISATNGKTTTAAMVASILGRDGTRLVHNRAGANMAGGVASALLDATRSRRGVSAAHGLFEVDELWLDQVVAQLRPRGLLLANLFRDQLDRFGELETIADRWATVVRETDAALVLNADDPLVADLGRDRNATLFGIEDCGVALAQMQHAADAKHCRRCGAPYRYAAIFVGHLGHYHCDSCGATRPAPHVAATDVTLDGVRGARFSLRTPAGTAVVALPLPGLYNVYNALGAAALALTLNASLDDVVAGLEAVEPAFGRAETVTVGDVDVLLLLVKNPAGANEVLRTVALEEGEHDVLAILNDNIADGRDISWVWDADFEVLAPRVRRVTCAGTRAAEMALRLKYAGVPADRIAIEPPVHAALDLALRAADRRLFALPTYTAMLALREDLVSRGAADGKLRLSDPVWHDVECGAYAADLALWRELAAACDGTVLDIGAGTGRVALVLALAGHDVVALDNDAALLAVLAQRAAVADLSVTTIVADARAFALGRRFGLVVVPMQTVQILGDAGQRRRFLDCARTHLHDGAFLAVALAQALDAFDSEADGLPSADVRVIQATTYSSLALAIVDEGDRAAIHRLRATIAPDGTRTAVPEMDVVRLHRLAASDLEREAAPAGFMAERRRRIAATDEHVGSTVVILRAC